MNVHFDDLLDRVTKFIQNEAKTETVVGEAFPLGEFTCIPVMRLSIGFGSGGTESDKSKMHGEGAGAGAAFALNPIGFLVSRGEDISFISTKTNKGLAAAFDKAPELLEKYLKTLEKQETLDV